MKLPRMKMHKCRVALVAVMFAALFPCSFASRAFAQTVKPVALLSDVATSIVDHPADNKTVARRRAIAFDQAGLNAIRTGSDFQLNLFADVALPLRVERAWRSHVDTWHWTGHVQGDRARSAHFVLHKGVVWASIVSRDAGTFRIRSHQGVGQVAEEIIEENFSPCGCGIEQAQEGRRALGIHPAGAVEDHVEDAGGIAGLGDCPGVIIDVMIVYSPEAREIEGGVAEIEALAFGLEGVTNASYQNSNVAQRIRVVHVAETGSELTGFSATLGSLANTSDGTYDEVHALRDQFGADLVAMLISHTNGGICGIGYLMGASEINPSFAQWGFTVTNTNCAQGGYTFQHELGHNMGCHHDHDNAGGTPAFPWSYGHRFTGNDATLYRTIMAYAPGQRISHFSNPGVSFQGQPTGVPQGTPLTEADNAASLNGTANTVAAFRPTAVLGGTSWPTPNMLVANDPDAGDRFGTSIAISGELAIIGAYLDDQAAADAGAAYIFKYNAGSGFWEQEAKLIAPDAFANDHFGAAVDIVDASDDLAIIGANLDDDGGRDSGAAYVFRRVGAGSWTYEGKIKSTDLFGGDSFGRTVAIASAGGAEIACVGSPLDDDAGSGSGSAYVFRKTGPGGGGGAGGWTQEQKLTALDPALNDNFGQCVDIEFAPDNVPWAIVGSYRDDDLAIDSGSAYVYRKIGAAPWTQMPKLLASDGLAGDNAGFAVALSFPDAVNRFAYVGAWKADAPMSNAGAVYVFVNSGGASFTQDAKLTASDPEGEANFGVSIDAHVDAVIVGAYTDDAGGLDAGAAYVYRRGGTGWAEEAKLFSAAAQANDQFGWCVAIDGARALAGAWQRDVPGGGVGLDAGAIYLSGGTGGSGIVDCNQNLVPDECDIFFGTSLDANDNGIPDECEPPPPCPGDFVPTGGDGLVNTDDLLAMLGSWGVCVNPANCPADIFPPGIGNDVVDSDDLLLMLGSWGTCP